FRSGLGFERLSLPEVAYGRSGLPKCIVKRSIHSRGTFCPHRDRSSVSIRWSSRLGRHKPREEEHTKQTNQERPPAPIRRHLSIEANFPISVLSVMWGFSGFFLTLSCQELGSVGLAIS